MNLLGFVKFTAYWLLSFCLTIDTTGAQTTTTCGKADQSITIAGSSTVAPIARAWADSYSVECQVTVSVEEGGSTAGGARVCANPVEGSPVDIGAMSRQWHLNEEVRTDYSGYRYQCAVGDETRSVIQVEVAIDGLSVTMSAGGVGANCVASMGGLTIHQLRWIFSNYTVKELTETGWDPKSLSNSDSLDTTHLWSELSSSCATEEIKIAGPDPASGTYEFFRETVLTDFQADESFDTRRAITYFNSANDAEIVQYVESDGSVIGFYGLAYYIQEGQSLLYAAPIQNYAGEFVAPEPDTVASGKYSPLSRRLFMNLHDDNQTLAVTAPFIEYGMSQKGSELVASTGYVPIPEEDRRLMISRVSGTPFVPANGPTASTTPAASSGTTPTSVAFRYFQPNLLLPVVIGIVVCILW